MPPLENAEWYVSGEWASLHDAKSHLIADFVVIGVFVSRRFGQKLRLPLSNFEEKYKTMDTPKTIYKTRIKEHAHGRESDLQTHINSREHFLYIVHT